MGYPGSFPVCPGRFFSEKISVLDCCKTMMDKDELIKTLEDRSVSLDDLVHEAMSNAAANINNSGVESQVDFLLAEGYTLAQLAELL